MSKKKSLVFTKREELRGSEFKSASVQRIESLLSNPQVSKSQRHLLKSLLHQMEGPAK